MKNKKIEIEKIEIDGEEISLDTIEVLKGEKGAEDLKEEWLPVARAIDTPDDLPFLISDIMKLEPTDELRQALIRAQVNAQLKMKRNLDFYKRQLFAARSMEVLLFKRLKLKSVSKKKSSKS